MGKMGSKPNKIIRQELRNTHKDIQPVYSEIKFYRKCMYDKRRKNIQKISKSLDKLKTQLFDSPENIIINSEKLFVTWKNLQVQLNSFARLILNY